MSKHFETEISYRFFLYSRTNVFMIIGKNFIIHKERFFEIISLYSYPGHRYSKSSEGNVRIRNKRRMLDEMT